MAHPLRMIIIGFLMLLVGGVVMPLLMVIQVIPVTRINETIAWLVIFGSYGASVAGLFMGIVGFTQYASLQKKKRARDSSEEYEGLEKKI